MTDNEEGDAMHLTKFLLARIAEDEVDARRAFGLDLAARLKDQAERVAHQHGSATPPDEPNAADRLWWTTQDVVQWLAPYGPARVLAEYEAKRRIVTEWLEGVNRLDEHGRPTHMFDPFLSALLKSHERWLRLLASIYADHPDYREEWKP